MHLENGCETQGRERIRQLIHVRCRFADEAQKNFLTLLDDVPSELPRYLIGHFTTLYLTMRGSMRNDN